MPQTQHTPAPPETDLYDLAIIGGGINGCGIARDAAGRGLSVVLLEKGDLAGATSSASTKLIHGGLRYLEYYDFRLVHEALGEREVLLSMAPHIIRPLRFVLPHENGLRPAWMIRIGLFIYDHLGGRRKLPGSNGVDLTRHPAGAALRRDFAKGFTYSDCQVDDARLVVLNAMDAAKRGAAIHTRRPVTRARRQNGVWEIETGGAHGVSPLRARHLVNAAGPWVNQVLKDCLEQPAPAALRLIKGSHIVVPRMFDHDMAYIFQNADRRVVFAIPFAEDFTLIGTTEVELEQGLDSVGASDAEIQYLCDAAGQYFHQRPRPDQVVWAFAGVRPLHAEAGVSARETTRDYLLDLQGERGQPVLLNVIGGKITTYRRLAESVLDRLAPHLPNMTGAWTKGAALPGGDFPDGDRARLVDDLTSHYPELPHPLLVRLVATHGALARRVLGDARTVADLGRDFGAGLYAREVAYLRENEFARTAEDILWRRTKLGLHLKPDQVAVLADWLAVHAAPVT